MSTFTGWNTGLLLCLDKRQTEPGNTATGLWGIGVLSLGTRGPKEGFEGGSGGVLTLPVLPVLEISILLCISRVL